MSELPLFGSGEYVYELEEGWVKLPQGWSIEDAAGVAVDKNDRVYIYHRGKHPVLVFERDGTFSDAWGDDIFDKAHNIRIGPDGMVYCVDYGDNTVRKLTPKGELLMTLGTPHAASDTGAVGTDFRTVKRSAGPFNKPTDVAFDRAGEMYVSDGYGNARVHHFSKDGALISSWGHPGSGQGEFHLPHNIAFDSKDRLLVADRENSRVQILTAEGEYLGEWSDANRPTTVLMDKKANFLVTELGYILPGWQIERQIPANRALYPRITIRSGDGAIFAWWGGLDMCAPGNFWAPHSMALDSRGDLYVGEVNRAEKAPKSCHTFQKFVRRRA